MSRRIDGFLSGKIQNVYPDALIFCVKTGEEEAWTMERQGQEPLGLGINFKQARMAISALVNAHIVSTGKTIKAEREKEGEAKS